MGLLLTERSKCSGCKALKLVGSEYQCALGLSITFKTNNGKPYGPRPEEKCYKPKNHRELKKAKELQAKR